MSRSAESRINRFKLRDRNNNRTEYHLHNIYTWCTKRSEISERNVKSEGYQKLSLEVPQQLETAVSANHKEQGKLRNSNQKIENKKNRRVSML